MLGLELKVFVIEKRKISNCHELFYRICRAKIMVDIYIIDNSCNVLLCSEAHNGGKLGMYTASYYWHFLHN